MLESLKDLSARATSGRWGVFDKANTIEIQRIDGHVVVHWSGFDAASGSIAKRRADARFLAALVNAYRSSQLHDATALAEAEARGRRQGLEEAAKAAERVRDDLYPILNKTRYQDYEVRRYHKYSAGLVVEDIRSLATAPTETQKPETGESDQ